MHEADIWQSTSTLWLAIKTGPAEIWPFFYNRSMYIVQLDGVVRVILLVLMCTFARAALWRHANYIASRIHAGAGGMGC